MAAPRLNGLQELIDRYAPALQIPEQMVAPMVAQPLSGLAGLYGLIHGGASEGAQRVQDVQQRMAYHATDPRAQRALAEIQQTMQPIGQMMGQVQQPFDATANNLAAGGYNKLATLAHIAPQAAMALAGGRQAMAAAPEINAFGRSVLERSAGPTMGGPMAQDGMIAYHGTPHRFAPTPDNELGAFDMSKIGTGEGAQAYGHGLYYAGDKAVAATYQKALSARHSGSSLTDTMNNLILGDKPLMDRYKIDSDREFADRVASGDTIGAAFHANDRASQWESLANDPTYPHQDYAQQHAQAWRGLTGAMESGEMPASKANGNLYHVDIPDEHVAKFLDWDKPLSEQHPDVRQALESAGHLPNSAEIAKLQGAHDDLVLSRLAGDNPAVGDQMRALERQIAQLQHGKYGFLRNATGEHMLDALTYAKGDPTAAADHLRELGIPGIKYLDGGSRGAGQGSHNYVVFDDKLPTIVGRE